MRSPPGRTGASPSSVAEASCQDCGEHLPLPWRASPARTQLAPVHQRKAVSAHQQPSETTNWPSGQSRCQWPSPRHLAKGAVPEHVAMHELVHPDAHLRSRAVFNQGANKGIKGCSCWWARMLTPIAAIAACRARLAASRAIDSSREVPSSASSLTPCVQGWRWGSGAVDEGVRGRTRARRFLSQPVSITRKQSQGPEGEERQ